MRKIIILLLFTLFIFSCQQGPQAPSFSFVFMTDIHIQPELDADEGFEQAIAKVNQLDPDFVITGGDLIMDALAQSHERSAELYDLYQSKLPEFNMPVYNTIGNHEIFGLYEKSGISPDHPEYGKTMYTQKLGTDEKSYYSFDHKNWHFMILDAVGFTPERRYIGKIDNTQMAWIAEDLKSVDPKTPIAISLHIPLASVRVQMSRGATAALSDGSVVTNSKEVLDLFQNHNLRLVLQGHLHIVEEIIYKGTHFITGGAVSGGWWKGAHEGFPEGFVKVSVKGSEFDWTYETFGWQARVPEQ
jgi:3',5'-cyclic AMP phosphodiesterase CpdA